MKPDLDSSEHIREFVQRFYDKVLADALLAPIFLEVAQIDLSVHLPIIASYWEKLLLGDTRYQRHTMNIHRELHKKRALGKAEFERWLSLFIATADEFYAGPKTERAKQLARSIAYNMDVLLNGDSAMAEPPRSRH
ncbi:MAG TPA: group III truncated hemoglobin [Pseudomonadales bacterium]